MRQLVEELPAALAAVDPQGQIVLVNREAAERLPGATAWIGRHVNEAWPAALARAALDAASAGAQVELEGRRFGVAKRQFAAGATPQSQLFLFHAEH
jgi:hypothetical protein